MNHIYCLDLHFFHPWSVSVYFLVMASLLPSPFHLRFNFIFLDVWPPESNITFQTWQQQVLIHFFKHWIMCFSAFCLFLINAHLQLLDPFPETWVTTDLTTCMVKLNAFSIILYIAWRIYCSFLPNSNSFDRHSCHLSYKTWHFNVNATLTLLILELGILILILLHSENNPLSPTSFISICKWIHLLWLNSSLTPRGTHSK